MNPKNQTIAGSPLVTVIAVCFNHAKFLIECLESIRNQTYKNVQLIIADDCSTDNSVELIRKWILIYDVDCIFLQHTKNKGLCRTLNEALSHSKGKYVSMVSMDDTWMLDKLEHQVSQMERLPENVGVLYSDAYMIDGSGNLLPKMFIESHQKFDKMPEGCIFPMLVFSNFIPAMSTLIRKACYKKVGFYDERLCYEDYDMWLRISQYFEFTFSPIVSAKYRIVPNSLVVRSIFPITKADKEKAFIAAIIIKSKCLRFKGMERKEARRIRNELKWSAIKLYELSSSKSSLYLCYALRYNFNLRIFALLLASFFQIKYKTLMRWKSYIRGIPTS